jgi:7-carboxy-7-deazaguanine synthase
VGAVARDSIEPTERLRVTEIFHSLQGEADTVGWPTAFIRLTGCPLRCRYCDTEYAFYGGDWRSIPDVIETIRTYRTRHVCVTGGEPLAQPNCPQLLSRLCDLGFDVSLETSGALDARNVDSRVRRVLDIKTPGSRESGRNFWPNFELLRPHDCIKFVICGRADYDWAVDVLRMRGLVERAEVLFSPATGEIEPRILAEWILADRLPVRFQIQLHKVLWGEVPGR